MSAAAIMGQPSEVVMVSERDHEDLLRAAELVNGVVDRHGRDVAGPALTAACAAIQEVRLLERYLGIGAT
jgi:hypothetical protein